jgi:DNA replication protein DnaC
MENLKDWEKWFGFQTLNDSQLEEMLCAASMFVMDIKAGQKPRWLSLLGTSGAGKTHLANRIYRHVVKSQVLKTKVVDDKIFYPAEKCYWPELGGKLQGNEGRDLVWQLSETQFVFLDDIGAKRDGSGFITGELSTLLGRRTGKWTIITANMSLQLIAEKVDPRLASRMIRDGSVVVDVDVVDFALRK